VTDTTVVLDVPALPVGATSLTLRWGLSENYTQSGTGYSLSNVGGTTVTITNFSPGTEYYFFWTTVNESGRSDGPAKFQSTTGTAAPLVVPAPRIYSLTETGFNTIVPSGWHDEKVSLYLQIKLSGANDSTYVNVPVSNNNIGDPIRSVTDVTPGQTYVVRYLAFKSVSGATMSTGGMGVAVTIPTGTTSWTVGAPISSSGIRYPFNNMTLKGGAVGRLNAYGASDWDILTRTTNGWGVSRYVTDTCSYTWSASGNSGTFTEGATGPTVLWQAPTVSTTTWVTLQLTVADQAGFNKGVSEIGGRSDVATAAADQPLRFTVQVKVVP
jgi:hypothetical protein